MKSLFLLLLISIVLTSCGGEAEPEKNPSDNFNISGIIEGAGNSTIYLEALSQQGAIEVAKGSLD